MRRTGWILAAVVVGGCGPKELRVTMNPDNNSGQAGFALLLDRGAGGITVTVETSAPDFASPQQAHVHQGNCGEVGEIAAGLQPLSPLEGKPGRSGSTTEVTNLSFSSFAAGDWLINVHDARDKGVYVSCGEVPRP